MPKDKALWLYPLPPNPILSGFLTVHMLVPLAFLLILSSVILCETKYSAFIVSHVTDVSPVYMYGLHILILRLENMALFTNIINIQSSLFCFVT